MIYVKNMHQEKINNDTYLLFNKAFLFANKKHQNQKITGSDLPYIYHISNVCFELLLMPNLKKFDKEFMLTVASLHDTLEDTKTTENEIKNLFGERVLSAVKSLSKDHSLPKSLQMEDSIKRILKEPLEVQIIKIADRISNLSPPPKTWAKEKIKKYHKSSLLIYERLKKSDKFMAERLFYKINEYEQYC